MEPAPFRPDLILWLELPQDLIVRTEILDPQQPVSFADSFAGAMARPMIDDRTATAPRSRTCR